jgi:antitoxin ParD1/3/4
MGMTERLTVELPSELVAMLRETVQRGDFSSESEALGAMLRAWHDDDDFGEDIDQIRAEVAESLAEADAGHLIDADEVHSELRSRIKAIADRRE